MKQEKEFFEKFSQSYLDELLENIDVENEIYQNLIANEQESINLDLKKIQDFLDEKKVSLNAEFEKDYDFEIKILDLIVLEYTTIYINITEEFGIFNDKDKFENKNYSLLISSLIMHQMSNNLIVLRNLLKDGFNFQAKIILRNIVEQGLTIFCILLDENFLKLYKENAELIKADEKYYHWKKNLRPALIDSILKERFKNSDFLKNQVEFFFELKDKLYSELSGVSHTQFSDSILSSLTKKESDKDFYNISFAGKIDSKIDDTLLITFLFFGTYFRIFIDVLKVSNDINFGRNDKNEGYYLFTIMNLRNKLLLEYFKRQTRK